jgi:hypothetical protein
MGIVASPALQAGRIDRGAIVARVPPAAVAGWAMERSSSVVIVRPLRHRSWTAISGMRRRIRGIGIALFERPTTTPSTRKRRRRIKAVRLWVSIGPSHTPSSARGGTRLLPGAGDHGLLYNLHSPRCPPVSNNKPFTNWWGALNAQGRAPIRGMT